VVNFRLNPIRPKLRIMITAYQAKSRFFNVLIPVLSIRNMVP